MVKNTHNTRNTLTTEIKHRHRHKTESKILPNGVNLDSYDGTHVIYRKNGQKWWETTKKGGKQHGTQTWWHENGGKDAESTWRGDRKHGPETWRNENGMKTGEVPWNNNEQHGVETVWWDNGMKQKEIYYVLGKIFAEMKWDNKENVIEVYFPAVPQKEPLSNTDKKPKSPSSPSPSK